MSKYVDLTQWPLVIVNWRPGFTTEDVKECIACLRKQHDRQELFAVCVDYTHIDGMTKEQHALFREYSQTNRDTLRKYNRGVGFAITSSAMRLAINSLILVIRSPVPVRAFSSQGEATSWLRDQLGMQAAPAARKIG